MTLTIQQGDALEIVKQYEGQPFHALLADPPYHLTTITKRFGKNGSKPAKYGTDGVFQRAARGFMGQTWDGGDIAFRPETWQTFLRVMYPGAFGLAFAGARTYHRIASAIEAAGFIIHPMIGWVYSSGFPKATHVAKGDETWGGYRYGLQALKPALEPLVVFQKPYDGAARDDIKRTGAGALNIEATKIRTGSKVYPINQFKDGAKPFGHGAGHEYETKMSDKRWPANFLGAEAPYFFCPKASTKERDAGLDAFPDREVFFHEGLGVGGDSNHNTTGQKAAKRKNHHPTVKPMELTKYLATLLLPPDAYAPRRLLNPFAGSGSEAIGATLAGWEDVLAIELDPAYASLALGRANYWLQDK